MSANRMTLVGAGLLVVGFVAVPWVVGAVSSAIEPSPAPPAPTASPSAAPADLADRSARADAWTQFGGSPARNHASPATGLPVTANLETRQNIRWIAKLGNATYSSPVVYDGRVYIPVGNSPEHGEGPGRVWCIDPTRRGDISPELVFNKANPNQPIAPKRWLACDEKAGDFTRPNPNSGQVWQYASRDVAPGRKREFTASMHRSIGSVALADGLAFVADLAGVLHCLDARTGQTYWAHDLLASCWSTPLVAEGRVYVSDEDGDVNVFRLSNRKVVLGEFNVGHSVCGSPAAVDRTLFLASHATLIALAVSPTTGVHSRR